MKLFDNRISTEETKTVQNKETEITIYAKVGNRDKLSEAASQERHFQYHSAFQNGQQCRVRKTVKEDVSKILFTIKVKEKESEGLETVNEVNTSVDEEFLEVFKTVSHHFVEKIRYNFHSENIELSFQENGEERTFKVPDIKYEVDVFIKEDGNESEWCKIDVEVDSILNYVNQNHPDIKNVRMNIKITHLPFEPRESIVEESATEEQKTFIKQLWDTEYNRK